MQIVVTDLTRMYGGHICVAGIDLRTNARIRPVLPGQLDQSLLRRNGGPFDIRAVVELGPCRPVGRAPEIEDHTFVAARAVYEGDMPAEEFYQLCSSVSHDNLNPIGPDLKRFGRSLTTASGKGACSLVLLKTSAPPQLIVRSGKLRHSFDGRTELSVTDVRLYRPNLFDPDLTKLADVQRRIGKCDEFVLSYGLGRAWSPQDEHRESMHYLQLNGVHLRTNPGWQLG